MLEFGFCLCNNYSVGWTLVWLMFSTTFLGGFEDHSGHCRHPDCTELSSMFYRHFQLLWNPTDTDCDRSNSFLGAGYWSGQYLHYGSDTSGIYSLIQTLLKVPVIFEGCKLGVGSLQCSAQLSSSGL